jgi:glycyl-tRNA synthetase alpha subunit
MQAMMKESKAKQQDLYLDSAMELDFDSHMRGKKMVEHDFIRGRQRQAGHPQEV